MPIKISMFVRSNVEWWIDRAQEQQRKENPMLAFICAWITFNNCYSLFWTSLRRELTGKNKQTARLSSLSGEVFRIDLHGYVPENFQIASFIGKGNPGFTAFWDHFVDTKGPALVGKITLPVIDLDRNEDIPDSKQRKVRLVDLETAALFRVLLTIRNNLFHGGKRITESRHLDVCACAAEFMVPFVAELVDHIEGVG